MWRKLAQEGDRVLIRRNCRACDGDGRLARPHCALCGQEVPNGDAWWESDARHLPCGHSTTDLIESVPCDVCEGSGRSRQWVPLSKYRTLRRRAIARGIVLLVAGLIPFVALSIAVYQSGLDNLCGSWWYGVVLLPACVRLQNGKTSR